ncbi:hypothetical protein [Sulfurospirillum arcachonense]|uniref:hypothetical protein n=1 Tax=Sulfurospirillum arcachonense TaxID=57666 RepID=UPI00046AED53|nr:hypothetical protein [Sulfurospirillum arcachonense]
MKISKLITLFLGITLFGSVLNATGMNPIPFKAFDHDRNGFVTKKEFIITKKARMKQNTHDGRLLRKSPNLLKFTRIDKNRDGRITKRELIHAQQLRKQNKVIKKKGRGKNFN